MATLDLVLYFAGGLIAIVMAILGGFVSSTKLWQKIAFITLGIASLIVYGWVGVRAFNQSKAASAEAAQTERKHQQAIDEIKGQLNASEIKRASDTRYLQGKLEVFAQFAPAILELAKASEENSRKQYEQKLLSNEQLRELVAEVVKKMRDWQLRFNEDSEKLISKYVEQQVQLSHQTMPGNSTTWRQKQAEISAAETREYMELRNRYEGEFNQFILGDAVYAKQELDSRISVKDRPQLLPQEQTVFLVFRGILAGPNPVGEAATYLENYVKRLSP